MDFEGFLGQIRIQATALRAAAVAAGPDAAVPTCPDWTVRKLVRHIAKVHNWVVKAIALDPDADAPAPEESPEEWDALLPWWDEQLATMLGALTDAGPDHPAWVFNYKEIANTGFWARRQAHETAIHRLDAEHASAGSGATDSLPSLVFDQDLAADGIDEALVLMVPRMHAKNPPDVTGTVLFHAADAGRTWLVRLTPGAVPEVGGAEEPALDADASVAGTADALYRAVWHRPSGAIVSGDRALVKLLRTP